jgi:hypothetical protein
MGCKYGIELKTLYKNDDNKVFTSVYTLYSPNETKILINYWTGMSGGIKIYDSDNYDVLYSYNINLSNGMVFMAEASFINDSNYIIIIYAEERSLFTAITIMDYTDGNIINTINNIDIFAPIAVSPDGSSICYSDDRKDIRVLKIN